MPSLNTTPTSTSTTAAVPSATGDTGVEQYLSCPTGVVEHYFASPGLRWSDEVYRIHGYERGEIVPTLELGVSHFEPADRDPARALWEALLAHGGPQSAYLSLRDAHGKVRKVLITGDYIRTDTNPDSSPASHSADDSGSDPGNDREGEPVGVWALVVDLTNVIHADTHKIANEAVAASALKRAVIEQAKGILMGRTGCTATGAFELINRHSQNTNRKVVVVAQDIIDHTRRPTQDIPSSNYSWALTEVLQEP